jgi:hypothetical protein
MSVPQTLSMSSAINSHDFAQQVTLDDTGSIPLTRALYVYHNNSGTVKVRMSNGDDLTFNFAAGVQIIPIRVTRVWSTGTTASLIVIALY